MKRAAVIVVVVVVALTSCSGPAADRPAEDLAGPQPSPSERIGLCQPFPDRLIDGFSAAYNSRDIDELEELVTAGEIRDVVAGAYEGEDATFEDVRDWAEAGWAVGDRMKLVGYSAFHPTKRGFQMMITRRSEALRGHGIAGVSTTLDAISRGCTIESLEMSGIVQAQSEPCAFYIEFASTPDVAANEPRSCRDLSGNHARTGHAAVWTGDIALIWGGSRSGQFTFGDMATDGLTFDPEENRWRGVPAPELPPFNPEAAAWTGEELIAVGGTVRPPYRVVAAGYDPRHRTWRELGFPFERHSGFEGVWTGSELVLWGGPDHSSRPFRRGLAYDPTSDTWRRTSAAPVGGRWSHSVVWTGTEMIVWGGGDANSDLATGAAYDPASDSWRELPAAPISARQWMPLTWTGSEMVVWGGSSVSRNQSDGAAYDPATNSWRTLAASPLSGRHYHSATWTGKEIVFFGGYNYHRTFRDGAAYDPASDSWRRISPSLLSPRCCHSAVWLDDRLFVFGGTQDLGHMASGDGALYDPDADRWRRVVPDVGRKER